MELTEEIGQTACGQGTGGGKGIEEDHQLKEDKGWRRTGDGRRTGQKEDKV